MRIAAAGTGLCLAATALFPTAGSTFGSDSNAPRPLVIAGPCSGQASYRLSLTAAGDATAVALGGEDVKPGSRWRITFRFRQGDVEIISSGRVRAGKRGQWLIEGQAPTGRVLTVAKAVSKSQQACRIRVRATIPQGR